MDKSIISEEVVRSRVPTPLKKAIKADVERRGGKANESTVLREILAKHYGIELPRLWGVK